MGWSINDFRRDFKELKKKYRECDNVVEKEKIINQMMTLCSAITFFEYDIHSDYDLITDDSGNLKIVNNTIEEEKELSTYFVNNIKFDMYHPFFYKFRKELNCLKDVDEFSFKNNEVQLNRKDVIELINEFFKHTNKEMYEYYLKFDKRKINYLKNESVDKGITYASPGVNRFYINVGEDGDKRRQLKTLIHERGHVIGQMINSDRSENKDFFSEIEGLFFELIAGDYFAKELNDTSFYNYQLNDTLMFYKAANKVLRCKEVSSKTFNNMSKTKSPFDLFKEYSKGEDLSRIDIPKDTRYVFSYLVALELREVYYKDKDMAFDLLKRIIGKNEEKTEYQRIIENVTPSKSLVKVRRSLYSNSIDNILSIKFKNTDK